jgi:hypothetical protein
MEAYEMTFPMFNPQAARERCEAATPVPWVQSNTHSDVLGPTLAIIARLRLETNHEANLDFIAHARSDLPTALEALEEAQRKLEAVREWSESPGAGERGIGRLVTILSKEGE